jgi:hypothetical protein
MNSPEGQDRRHTSRCAVSGPCPILVAKAFPSRVHETELEMKNDAKREWLRKRSSGIGQTIRRKGYRGLRNLFAQVVFLHNKAIKRHYITPQRCGNRCRPFEFS